MPKIIKGKRKRKRYIGSPRRSYAFNSLGRNGKTVKSIISKPKSIFIGNLMSPDAYNGIFPDMKKALHLPWDRPVATTYKLTENTFRNKKKTPPISSRQSQRDLQSSPRHHAIVNLIEKKK